MRHFFLLLSIICVCQCFVTLPIQRSISLKEEIKQSASLSGGDKKEGFSYFVQINVGTPPTPHKVIVDTGSAWLVVIGKTCKYIPAKGPLTACKNSSDGYYYKNSKSSSFANCSTMFDNPDIHNCPPCSKTDVHYLCCGGDKIINEGTCQVLGTYAMGASIAGDVVEDVVTLGTLTTDAFITVVQNEAGPQQIEAGGIMGLGYSALSSGVPTWLDRLVEQYPNISNSFSTCLGSGPDEGGQLVVGGVDEKHFSGAFNYTAIDTDDKSLYYVDLQHIIIGDSRIETSEYKTIIDSGSTLIHLPEDIYDSVLEALNETCRFNDSSPLICGKNNLIHGPDQCCGTGGKASCAVFGNENAFAGLPEMSFFFQNNSHDSGVIAATLNGSDYVRHWWQEYDSFCGKLGFTKFVASNRTTEPMIILGDTFLKAFYINFDRQNNRIGFAAPKACGYSVRPDEEDNGWSKSLIIALCVVGGILALIAVAIVGYMIVKTIASRRASAQGYTTLPDSDA